jgi:hypothetical protein
MILLLTFSYQYVKELNLYLIRLLALMANA